MPALVAINRYGSDTETELRAMIEHCAGLGVPAAVADVYGRGGAGGESLARALSELLERGSARFRPLYDWQAPIKATGVQLD